MGAFVEIRHPETEHVAEVPESTLHIHARKGWVRVDGLAILKPATWTEGTPDPVPTVDHHGHLQPPADAPDDAAGGQPSLDELRAALDTAIAEHGNDSDQAQQALTTLTAAEAATDLTTPPPEGTTTGPDQAPTQEA